MTARNWGLRGHIIISYSGMNGGRWTIPIFKRRPSGEKIIWLKSLACKSQSIRIPHQGLCLIGLSDMRPNKIEPNMQSPLSAIGGKVCLTLGQLSDFR